MIFECISHMHAVQNYMRSGYYTAPGYRAQWNKNKRQSTVCRRSGMDGAPLLVYRVYSFLVL